MKGISSKSANYSQKIFGLLVDAILEVDSSPTGLISDLIRVIMHFSASDESILRPTITSTMFIFEAKPLTVTKSSAELVVNCFLSSCSSKGALTSHEFEYLCEFSLKIMKLAPVHPTQEELHNWILSKIIANDPIMVYRQSKFVFNLFRVYNKLFGSEKLNELLPPHFKKLFKSFIRKINRSAAGNENQNGGEDAGSMSSMTKTIARSKITLPASKISRKSRKLEVEPNEANEDSEIIDLIERPNNNRQTVDVEDLEKSSVEKCEPFEEIDGKIVVKEDKKERYTGNDENLSDSLSQTTHQTSKTKRSKFSIGSEFRSKKAKGDMKIKGVEQDPYAYVEINKNLFTHKGKVVKGAFDDLFKK